MAKEYRFSYKCRLCGATFHGSMTTNKELAHNAIIDLLTESPVFHQGVYKETFHQCNADDMGIADIKGVKAYEV